MSQIFDPKTTSTNGLVEFSPDKTAGKELVFYHADEGQPLATPWQVALARSKLLTELQLPEGYILDCACGSGIQLGAHIALLQRPGIGVELNPARAQASAVNIQSIAKYRNETTADYFVQTRILSGDGRDGAVVCASIADHFQFQSMPSIAFLHLDPARPRNSRTHGLNEMAPRLDEVFQGWKKHLNHGPAGPSILLDLSPRLSHQQRLDVETMVDQVWQGIARTWVWTSRGRGRIDRLALWLGGAASAQHARRFVRIPPTITEDAKVVSGGLPIKHGDGIPQQTQKTPQRGEYMTILDAALVESGLANDWISTVTKSDEITWNVVEGRRPQIHHQKPLRIDGENNRLMVQATGRIVALAHTKLMLETVDELVELCLENDISQLTVRAPLSPDTQPKIQGAFDRQLSRRHGRREAFLIQHSGSETLVICVVEKA